MKVELEKLRLGYSELSETVYAGILNKKGNQWLKKTEVTDDFINCVIQKYQGSTETIECDGEEWEITVKKIK